MIAPTRNEDAPSHQGPTQRQAWSIAYEELDRQGLLCSQPSSMLDRISYAVGKKPALAIGIATAIGVTAGWLLKRKL
ncbi:MAG: hypothetical protein R3C05_19650 [Pirellulaceae bacterium]